MMRGLRTVALLLSLFLSGCSQFEQLRYQQRPVFHVDKLVLEHAYGRALNFMDGLPAEQQARQVVKQRRQQLLKQARAYEQQRLTEARQLVKQERWAEALAVLEGALSRYPAAELLPAEKQHIELQRKEALLKRWLAFNRQRGESLPNLLTAIEQIVAMGDQSSQAREIQQFYRRQSQSLASYFSARAEQYSQQKQWRQALQYFQLADRLRVEPRHQDELARLRQYLRPESTAKPTQSSLQERLAQSLEEGDLLPAQQWLDALRRYYPELDTDRQQRQLQQRIDSRVQREMKLGSQHYAQGELEAAIDQWRRALLLSPGHAELQRLLTRAEEFKARYENLRQEQ